MEYIIIKAKDIKHYSTPYDSVAICESIIINCAQIERIETFINRFPENDTNFHVLVLHMTNGDVINIPDDMLIETNWDLIMCYHKKSTRIEL